MYALELTNKDNGGELPDWDDAGIPAARVTISDDGARLVAEPQGTMAAIFTAWLGTRTFTGPSQGAHLELVLAGTRLIARQTCTYTFDVTIDAVLDGDQVEGRQIYHARTNGDRTCSVLDDCASRQALRGTREAP